MTDQPLLPTAAELGTLYRQRKVAPSEIARQHLARIEQLDPVLHAMQYVDVERALAAAQESDGRWTQGRPRGPLDGVPMTIKDNVDMAGLPTRHGSRTSPETPASIDSPVVARLREAGAVILGKTRLPEFGWTGLAASPLHNDPVRNPWNIAASPGGSSGGAAACVAAGIGAIAFGNDGGGSIRVPASFCGLCGLKPTFGRVPHHPQEGVFATLVAGGPITHTVADAVTALAVMAKPDDRDWFALPAPPADWLTDMHPRLGDLRIAYAPVLGGIAADDAVRTVVDNAIERLREAGATIIEVASPIAPLKERFEAYWIAGFASRLRTIPRARWDEVDPGFRALAERGLAVETQTLLDGEAARAALGREFAAFHRDYDLLLTPTVPHVAPPVETIYHSPNYDRWRDGVPFTLPFNLTGQPALTMPCGLARSGLPVGLQIAGPRYSERSVLECGLAIEVALDCRGHRRASETVIAQLKASL